MSLIVVPLIAAFQVVEQTVTSTYFVVDPKLSFAMKSAPKVPAAGNNVLGKNIKCLCVHVLGDVA